MFFLLPVMVHALTSQLQMSKLLLILGGRDLLLPHMNSIQFEKIWVAMNPIVFVSYRK